MIDTEDRAQFFYKYLKIAGESGVDALIYYINQLSKLEKINKKLQRTISKLQNKLSVVINEKKEECTRLENTVKEQHKELVLSKQTMIEQASVIYNTPNSNKYYIDINDKANEIINNLELKIKELIKEKNNYAKSE